MSNTYYSPEGNAEIWEKKPKGYLTPEEWEYQQIVKQQTLDEEEKRRQLLPENLYPARIAEVESAYKKAMDKLTRRYPDAETSTFYRQLQEAKDYIANKNDLDVPFLINAANQRNVSPTALALSILEQADAYAAISGYLTGKRHKLLSEINAIGTSSTEALLNVAIDFTVVDEEVL